MNILIVGSSGYIGSRLSPYLSQWHTVTNYDITHGEDIRNTLLLKKFCEGKQVVIYLASLSNNDMCNRSPSLAAAINQSAFPSVLRVVGESSVERFIYASSVAVYGSQDNADETCKLNPTTRYAEGKAYCESLLGSFPYVITRCASVCGYSPRMRYDLMVNKMTRDAAQTGKVIVNGGGQIRSHIHINDVLRAYRFLLDAKGIEGEAFNIVAENMSVLDTATLVAQTLGSTMLEVYSRTDNRSYSVSGKKAQDVLGFKPLYSVADAVLENYLNYY